MSNRLLFVFEGEKTEDQITRNLTQFFINENTVITCAYCNDIYELHREISSDQDLDTYVLLKETPQNEEALAPYNRSDFAEIYMFFDYDGHDNLADDSKIDEALKFFNEETASGKLLISYPMVEALKHYSEETEFKLLKVKAKENIGYKAIVGENAKNGLIQINKYNKETWFRLLNLHGSKANFIVNGDFSLPKNQISQEEIFLGQLEKYIKIDSTVAVLSSFPLFLFDYYGYEYLSSLIEGNNIEEE